MLVFYVWEEPPTVCHKEMGRETTGVFVSRACVRTHSHTCEWQETGRWKMAARPNRLCFVVTRGRYVKRLRSHSFSIVSVLLCPSSQTSIFWLHTDWFQHSLLAPVSGTFRSPGWVSQAAARCPSSSGPAGGVCTAPRRPASEAAASSCSLAAAGWTARLTGPETSRPRGAGSSRSGSSGPWAGNWGGLRSPGRVRCPHCSPCTRHSEQIWA